MSETYFECRSQETGEVVARGILTNFTEPGEYRISADGKIYTFEWHSYCGPTALNKRGDPLTNQPQVFLFAASQWNSQGRKMEDGLCVWFHEPEMITKHISGRQYLYLGEHPPKRGS